MGGFPQHRAQAPDPGGVENKQICFKMSSQLILIYQVTFLKKIQILISALMVAYYPVIIIRKQDKMHIST